MAFAVFVNSIGCVDAVTLERLKVDDLRIVLVQDGVYHLFIKDSPVKKKDAKVYVLKEDLESRGFSAENVSDAEVVDYSKLVDLMMEEFNKMVWL